MTTYRKSHMTLSSIGIDIGKDVFHLVGFDESGTLVIRRKIKRLALIKEFEKFPPCIVGMEACLSAIMSVGRYGGWALNPASSRPNIPDLSLKVRRTISTMPRP